MDWKRIHFRRKYVRVSYLSSIYNQIDDTDCLKSIYDAFESDLDKAQLHTSNRKRIASNKNSEVQKKLCY